MDTQSMVASPSPNFFTQSMHVGWFMTRWMERERLLTLQAMGLPVLASRRPRRESTIPDLGPQPVPLPATASGDRASATWVPRGTLPAPSHTHRVVGPVGGHARVHRTAHRDSMKAAALTPSGARHADRSFS